MNDSGSSPGIDALLQAARKDGPSAAARAKMWTGVSGALGGATAAGGAAVGVAKLATTATLFGGAMTVGVAAVLLYVGSAKAPDMPTQAQGASVQLMKATEAPEAIAVESLPVAEAKAEEASAVPSVEAVVTPEPALRPARHKAHPAVGAYDSIGREASLVATAQAALVRGDGRAALRAINQTLALPSRQLEPEELAVRAQALRALGMKREADAADAKLKASYPLSALVRSR